MFLTCSFACELVLKLLGFFEVSYDGLGVKVHVSQSDK